MSLLNSGPGEFEAFLPLISSFSLRHPNFLCLKSLKFGSTLELGAIDFDIEFFFEIDTFPVFFLFSIKTSRSRLRPVSLVMRIQKV